MIWKTNLETIDEAHFANYENIGSDCSWEPNGIIDWVLQQGTKKQEKINDIV